MLHVDLEVGQFNKLTCKGRESWYQSFDCSFWLLLVEAMAEPIDVDTQVGNPGGKEPVPTMQQAITRKKGARDKSRELAHRRDELGQVDFRLAKIELKLVDDEERFEMLELHLEELNNGVHEFRGKVQGVLNAGIDKLASKGENMCHNLVEELAAV